MVVPVPFQDPRDLQDHPDSQEILAPRVSKETEDFQEHLVVLDLLVVLVLKVLQDTPERRETQVMPSQ